MRKKSDAVTELDLMKSELQQVQDALLNAYHRFDRADAPELIDACIYEIKACSARYNYLYRLICDAQSESAPAAVKEAVSWV